MPSMATLRMLARLVIIVPSAARRIGVVCTRVDARNSETHIVASRLSGGAPRPHRHHEDEHSRQQRDDRAGNVGVDLHVGRAVEDQRIEGGRSDQADRVETREQRNREARPARTRAKNSVRSGGRSLARRRRPARPARPPENSIESMTSRPASTPTVSAKRGFDPAARSFAPHSVRKSASQTTGAIMSATSAPTGRPREARESPATTPSAE